RLVAYMILVPGKKYSESGGSWTRNFGWQTIREYLSAHTKFRLHDPPDSEYFLPTTSTSGCLYGAFEGVMAVPKTLDEQKRCLYALGQAVYILYHILNLIPKIARV